MNKHTSSTRYNRVFTDSELKQRLKAERNKYFNDYDCQGSVLAKNIGYTVMHDGSIKKIK